MLVVQTTGPAWAAAAQISEPLAATLAASSQLPRARW
jgi:hypothetical protein